jgi:tetratricopeptide (TPR) repeat protein
MIITMSNGMKRTKKSFIDILTHFRSEKNSNDKIKSAIGKDITWIDRFSDEANLWLKATALDSKGDFITAIPFYLKDVKYCLEVNLTVRAALSCSCAANCMTKIGHLEEAHKLYAKAAALYVHNANKVMGDSIREALWSLQQAYENYSIALDETNAKQVYDMYVSIVTKISPFGNLDEKMEIMGFRKISIRDDKMQYSDVKISPLDQEIKNAVNEIFY